MVDAYKHDYEGVCTIITSLKEINNNYNNKITELNNLVISINNSSLWIDLEIKTTFVETCNSYIKIYNELKQAVDIYINYLEQKSDAGHELEQTYARCS